MRITTIQPERFPFTQREVLLMAIDLDCYLGCLSSIDKNLTVEVCCIRMSGGAWQRERSNSPRCTVKYLNSIYSSIEV